MVIAYCGKRYGENGICSIMTRGTLAAKNSIQNVAKVYGNIKAGDHKTFQTLFGKINKMITDPAAKIPDVREEILDKFKDTADYEDVVTILDYAEKLEGTFEHVGKHAAGVVISDNRDIKQYCPLMWDITNSTWKTQWDKEEVESGGMLKMDFLGLINLDIITKCLRLLPKEVSKNINVEQLAYHAEPEVLKIFAEADTDAVFQFESGGMKSMIKQFQPTTFDDLVLLVAAYRPGPMQFLPDIMAVKHKKKPVEYLTPELESILGNTYGAIVYQEQVQQIFRELAGYSLGGADLVRRIMGHKEPEKLVPERQAFVYGDPDRKDAKGNPSPIHGCVAKGISEEIANKLFDQMSEFAKYAFNKSHAASYATVAYITAWLKYHYPKEYFCAVLEYTPRDKTAQMIESCRKRGLKIHQPDINVSESGMSIHNDSIYLGFNKVLNMGTSGTQIVEERKKGKFVSILDFIKRVRVNKAAVEALVKGGAFDNMNSNRKAVMQAVELMSAQVKNYNKYRDAGADLNAIKEALENMDPVMAEKLNKEKKTGLASITKRIEKNDSKLKEAAEALNNILIYDTSEDMNTRLEEEFEILGAYITMHPLDIYRDETSISTLEEEASKIKLLASINELRTGKGKKSEYAFFTCRTRLGDISGACFDSKIIKMIAEKSALILEGSIKPDREGVLQMVVSGARVPMANIKTIGYRLYSRAGIEQAEKIMSDPRAEGNDYNVRFFIESEGIWHNSTACVTSKFVNMNKEKFIKI